MAVAELVSKVSEEEEVVEAKSVIVSVAGGLGKLPLSQASWSGVNGARSRL